MIAELQTAISNTPRRKSVDQKLTPADRAKIRIERMALLMRGAPVAIGVTLVSATITLAAARTSIDRTIFLAWGGPVLFLAAAMLVLWIRYSRPSAPAHGLALYSNLHIVWMGLNGVLWGALAPISAVHGLMGNAFLPFLISGMTAAALASAGSSWRSVLAFNIPALLPFAAVYAIAGGAVGYLIAAIVVLFAVATGFLAWTMQQMITRSIKLRSRNNRLLDALKKQVDAAHEAEKRFRGIVESSQELTLIFSPEGVIVYASPAVEAILGAPPRTIVGKTTKDILHPDDLPILREVGEKSLSTIGEVIPMSHVCFKAESGDYVPLSGRLTNMLYVPGVDGFVFRGARISKHGGVRLHAAE